MIGHEDLSERLEELVKKNSSSPDFAEAVGKGTSHHSRTVAGLTSTYILAHLPCAEGTIQLGSLMDDLKEIGNFSPPILFREKDRSNVEFQGKVEERRYVLQLISDDKG